MPHWDSMRLRSVTSFNQTLLNVNIKYKIISSSTVSVHCKPEDKV